MVLSCSDSCDLCIEDKWVEYIACSVSAAHPHHAFWVPSLIVHQIFAWCCWLCIIYERVFNNVLVPNYVWVSLQKMMKEKGKLTSEEEEGERERERERERKAHYTLFSRVWPNSNNLLHRIAKLLRAWHYLLYTTL